MPMKYREVLELLRRDGWTKDRQKGSHMQFIHSTKPGTITVAGTGSKEVPPGTLNVILKQAGLK
jgi:predicted RNA binding protein YcfA (HicA-like mRNA interferase family)